MKIEIETRPVTSPRDFVGPDAKRILGLVYFQKLNEQLIPRVVTDRTDKKLLQQQIKAGRIFLPTEKTTAELS